MTKRMRSNDLKACGKKSKYFLYHFEVKFLVRFERFFDLVVVYFNAISIDFFAVKCFICINYM